MRLVAVALLTGLLVLACSGEQSDDDCDARCEQLREAVAEAVREAATSAPTPSAFCAATEWALADYFSDLIDLSGIAEEARVEGERRTFTEMVAKFGAEHEPRLREAVERREARQAHRHDLYASWHEEVATSDNPAPSPPSWLEEEWDAAAEVAYPGETLLEANDAIRAGAGCENAP